MGTESSLFETREQFLERRVRDMFPVDACEDRLSDFKALAELLAAAQAEGRHHACQLVDSAGSKVPFPEVAVFILKRVAEVLAQGDSIATIPTDHEFSTEEAAKALHVDPEYVDRLIDEGTLPTVVDGRRRPATATVSIPCTKTGEHRRIHAKDLLAFKYKWEQECEKGLNELIHMADEVGAYEDQERFFQNEK